MKTVKRIGLFETNSSSSHSISIAQTLHYQTTLRNSLARVDKTKILKDTLPISDGKVTIVQGEFGWGEERYTDAATKASYALTHASRNDPDQLAMLRRVLERECKCEVVFSDVEGYIDHQSQGTAHEAFESEEKLHQFIFNPASVLHIDHDNH